jgi:zinc protease
MVLLFLGPLVLWRVPAWGFSSADAVWDAIAVERFTAANGLQVLLAERHANPFIEAKLTLRAGVEYDPPGREGLSSLTAAMLTEGAGTLEAEAFWQRLAYHGIGLAAGAGLETLSIHLTTLTDHQAEGWARLGDVVLRPRFDLEPLKRHKVARWAALRKRLESGVSRAQDHLMGLMFRGHPYASHHGLGTKESITRLTRDDLVVFHRRMFRAGGAVLVVAGEMNRAQLETMIQQHLALPPGFADVPPIPSASSAAPSVAVFPNLDPAHPEGVVLDASRDLQQAETHRKADESLPVPMMPRADASSEEATHDVAQTVGQGQGTETNRSTCGMSSGMVAHIEMDEPQTTIVIGFPGLKRHDPDYFPLLVMNEIFGGTGLTSRLSDELREKRGLTYGVYSTFSLFDQGGVFLMRMKTKSRSVSEAIEILKQEARRLAGDGVSSAELSDAKRYLMGSHPLHFDTLAKLTAEWSSRAFNGYPPDHLHHWPHYVQAVTAVDVLRVARRLFCTDDYHVITVGRGK